MSGGGVIFGDCLASFYRVPPTIHNPMWGDDSDNDASFFGEDEPISENKEEEKKEEEEEDESFFGDLAKSSEKEEIEFLISPLQNLGSAAIAAATDVAAAG